MADSAYFGSDNDQNEQQDEISENLIMNTCSALKSTRHTIYCGLNPSRFFAPTINIVYNWGASESNKISLDRLEWNELILHLNKWSRDYSQDCNFATEPKFFLCNKKLIFSSYQVNESRFAVLSKHGVDFYFQYHEVLELTNLNSVISTKIDFMLKLNFCDFYYDFLDDVNLQLYKCNYKLSAIDLVQSLCNFSNNLQMYCIFELFIFNREKFLVDLYNRR